MNLVKEISKHVETYRSRNSVHDSTLSFQSSIISKTLCILTSLPKALRGSFLFFTLALDTDVQVASRPDFFLAPVAGGGEDGLDELAGVEGIVAG